MRGANGEGRSWWDLRHYELHLEPDVSARSLKGKCVVSFLTLEPGRYMQIDLQAPMVIKKVVDLAKNNSLSFNKVGDAVYFIDLGKTLLSGRDQSISIEFEGVPREAVMPPWDGGLQWTSDELGRDWIAVSCQGIGASVWWPCKDIQSDEPDRGMDVFITVPSELTAVSNGRLISRKNLPDNRSEWHWRVVNTINNYAVTMNLGHYAVDTFIYKGIQGDLPCSIYLLDIDKKNFEYIRKEINNMLACFEAKVGPFPFYKDGYKITQTPFLGMEHQSNISYGNRFVPGYLGMDRSNTGLGLQWDFIIVHESGHEWFGNSITAADISDNWIHEGFTTYLETLLTECHTDAETARRYVIGQQSNIQNDYPLDGPDGVHFKTSTDIYDKGANMINMIRLMMQDDAKFFAMLRQINVQFYHKIITSAQMEQFLIDYTGLELEAFFDQYLRTNIYPVIGYKVENGQLTFQLLKGAAFPVAYLDKEGKRHFITPSSAVQTVPLAEGFLRWDPAFLLDLRNM